MKKICSFLLIAVLLCSMSVCAFADEIPNNISGSAVFTAGGVMSETNLVNKNVSENVDQIQHVPDLQPGDWTTFECSVRNDNAATTDWYMTNSTINSLEEMAGRSLTAGGGYEYSLTWYPDAGDPKVLYDSSDVGGENSTGTDREGLNEATAGLEEYFYFDTLRPGQGGKVVLYMAMDGESQGNIYQDTKAEVMMNFAVQLVSSPENPNVPKTVVKTADNTNLLPYYIVMGVSGLLFLILAVDSLRRRRKENEA